jgi:hypothetical protein
MKIRAQRIDARIMTQVIAHHQNVRQHAGDTSCIPAFGIAREVRSVNFIYTPPLAAQGRKVRVLKSGIRRITYK